MSVLGSLCSVVSVFERSVRVGDAEIISGIISKVSGMLSGSKCGAEDGLADRGTSTSPTAYQSDYGYGIT